MNIGHGAGRRPTGRLGIVAAAVAIALLGSGCDDGSSDVSYYPDNNSYGNGDSGYGTGGGYYDDGGGSSNGYSYDDSSSNGYSYDDGSSNGYDYDDGGIAPDRFDPAPAKGPLTPG